MRPAAVATLGATAGKALMGPSFRITETRGQVLDWEGHRLVRTVHPSAILRGPGEARDEALAALVADLQVVAGLRPQERPEQLGPTARYGRSCSGPS